MSSSLPEFFFLVLGVKRSLCQAYDASKGNNVTANLCLAVNHLASDAFPPAVDGVAFCKEMKLTFCPRMSSVCMLLVETKFQ